MPQKEIPVPIPILLPVAMIASAPAPLPPVNTKCPVCGGKVDAKCRVVAVNGRSFYVCSCPDCLAQLKNHPEKYLNADGSLKLK